MSLAELLEDMEDITQCDDTSLVTRRLITALGCDVRLEAELWLETPTRACCGSCWWLLTLAGGGLWDSCILCGEKKASWRWGDVGSVNHGGRSVKG